MKKVKEKICEWVITPKGCKTMGRIVTAFCAAAAGTMGYLIFDMGRNQGAIETLVEEKAFLEGLSETTKEILEEGQ